LVLCRLLLGVLVSTSVAAQPSEPRIYTCVDAKGRRLTADRPIPECLDREQRELNPSGTVRRVVGPTLTAQERLEQEEKARRAAEEKARADAERRVDKLLVERYPDAESHARAREAALQAAKNTLQAYPDQLAAEQARVNARFDAELARLRPQWSQKPAPGAAR
jgi:hypothetical protein